MTKKELVDSLLDHSFNMSEVYSNRECFSRKELADVAQEIFYTAFVYIDPPLREEFLELVAESLADVWGIRLEQNS